MRNPSSNLNAHKTSFAKRTGAFALAVALSASLAFTGCAQSERVSDDATPQADGMSLLASETIGGLTVAGGTKGTDYTVDDTNKKIVIKTSTPLTVSGTSTGYSLEVAAGTHAVVTLDNCNIQFNRTGDTRRIPINLVTNVMDEGAATPRTAAATEGDQITNPTSLHLILADDSVNNLSGGYGAPAIRCGEGSRLVVDDSVLNVDNDGNSITPVEGRVPADLTLQNGTEIKAGDPLFVMDSTKPGKLVALGGSGGAGIGSGPNENSGYMEFNGGNLSVQAYNSGATDANTGAGIGGSIGGGATMTVFNGGVVDAVGSYHGAGIGAGCTIAPGAWGGYYGTNADAGCRRLPIEGAIINRESIAGGGNGQPKARDITVNGGNITSRGYEHGFAFGGACGSSSNAGHKLLITGGNLTPLNSAEPSLLLGATGMEIVVQGGSFYVPTFGRTVTDGRGHQLQMVTIDLAGFDELKGAQLKNLKVTVDGAPLTNDDGTPYDYGMPYGVDTNGRVYFWLPNTVNGKNVAITNFETSILGTDGKRTNDASDFDFVVPSVGSGSVAKRYVEIDMDDYIKNNTEMKGQLFKRYDGLTIGVGDDLRQTMAELKVPAGEPKGEYLDDATKMKVTYRRYVDKDGNDTTDATQEGSGYINAGGYKLIVESTEWSADANFSKSFWGHKLYLSSEIIPADSEVSVVTHTLSHDDMADPKALTGIKLEANVMPRTEATDELPAEAKTCAAPTGKLQFYANGIPVGDPVDVVPASGANDKGYAYSTALLNWTDFDKYQIPRNSDGKIEIQGKFLGGENYNASDGLSSKVEPSEIEDFPFAATPVVKVKGGEGSEGRTLTPQGPTVSGDPDPEATDKGFKNTLHSKVHDNYNTPVQENGTPLTEEDIMNWIQSYYGIEPGNEFKDLKITKDGEEIDEININELGGYQISVVVRDPVSGNTTTLEIDYVVGKLPDVAHSKVGEPGVPDGVPLDVTDVGTDPTTGKLAGNAHDSVTRLTRPGEKEDVDSIQKWIEDYYAIPEGSTISKPVIKDKDGNVVTEIDASDPGSYTVTFDVMDEDGNTVHVLLDYKFKEDPELKPKDPDKSDLIETKEPEDTGNGTTRRTYEDRKPVVVEIDPDVQKEPIGKDDILKEADERYDVPSDWEKKVVITGPDGKEVNEIDPNTPGIYTATITYTTPDGNEIVVTQTYVVKEKTQSSLEDGNKTPETPNDNENGGNDNKNTPQLGEPSDVGGAGDDGQKGFKGFADNAQRVLAQTGDETLPLMVGLGALMMGALSVVGGVMYRRKREGE